MSARNAARTVFQRAARPACARILARAIPACAFAALLLSSGCQVGPDYQRPLPPVPEEWRWKNAPADNAEIDSRWWLMFNDPKLNELETLALEANQDLKRAIGRVDEARALAHLSKADFYPQLSANPAFKRSGDSANAFQGGGSVSADRHPRNLFNLPLSVSYEADVWGRVRRSASAAGKRAEASVADYHAVTVTVTSEVAAHFFLLHALDAEVVVLQNTRVLRDEFLRLVESQFKFGAAGALEVSRAKTDVAATAAKLVDVKRRREQTVHVLAVLCGKPAPDFSLEAKPLSAAPPEIPAGLPAALLQRRPDVVSAERKLAAANEEIGVARAAFFPRLALTGTGGLESRELSQLFNWQSTAWQVAANLTAPIFSGGRNKAQLEAARSRYEQAEAEYRQRVLVAFREVEDALLDIQFRAEEEKAVAEAVASAREATKLATLRYEGGQVSQLEVVDSQRRQLELEQQAAQVLGQRLVSAVLLVKALGGGWKGMPEIDADAPQQPALPAQPGPQATPGLDIKE